MAFIQINCFSHVLRKTVNINVVLPQEPRKEFTDGRGIPTLYLLHGKSDDHSAWMRLSNIELYASTYGIAVIMPTTDLGWYTNTKYDARYWDYVSEELPELCERFFPQLSEDPQDRFVAGLSMGGYGAMKLGLCAPEKFSMAASLSGAVDFVDAAQRYLSGPEAEYWRHSFGEVEEIRGTSNDLHHVVRQLKENGTRIPKLYAWCGTEDFLFERNQEFAALLNELEIPLTYETSEGDHSWKYWDEKIQRVLEWIAENHDLI